MLLSTIAMAQEKSTETFGPSKGDLSTEVQFNPLSNSKNSFQLDALKLRYFLNEKNAVRVNVGLGIKSNKDYNNNEVTYTKVTNYKWSIDLGYEKHYSIAPRMDIYFGYELGIQKEIEETTLKTYKDQIVTPGNSSSSSTKSKYNSNSEKNDYFGCRTTAFTGFDLYVYRGLYLGTELGLRFARTKKGETIKKTGNDKEIIKDPDTNTSLGFFAVPSIRLGWTF